MSRLMGISALKWAFFPQAGGKENLRGIEVTENIFKGIKHHKMGEKKGGKKVEKKMKQ